GPRQPLRGFVFGTSHAAVASSGDRTGRRAGGQGHEPRRDGRLSALSGASPRIPCRQSAHGRGGPEGTRPAVIRGVRGPGGSRALAALGRLLADPGGPPGDDGIPSRADRGTSPETRGRGVALL